MKLIVSGCKAAVCVLILSSFFICACAPMPRCTQNSMRPEDDPRRQPLFGPKPQRATGGMERGYCSFISQDQHGAQTASGEFYNMYKMVAAHKTLPFGSIVRVTNLNNGRSVKVRIQDRGPNRNDRLIDVSYAAAVQLGMVRDGLVLADVQLLKRGNGATYHSGPVQIQSAPVQKKSSQTKRDETTEFIEKAKEKIDQFLELLLNKD